MFALPLLMGLSLAAGPKVPTYSVIQRMQIGGEGGWDYLAIDSASHHLFISRGTHAQVLDVETGKIVADIPNTQGIHGFALVPKADKVYISNGRDNSVSVINMKTLKEVSRVKVGQRPDAITFDPVSDRVFTFNAGSEDSTAIDTKTDKVVGSVPLGGKPEFPQVDDGGVLFVNIEDKSEVKMVDTNKLTVLTKWSLAPGEEPSGLALDKKDHLLFSTCSNDTMAISDLSAGKLVGTAKIGGGPDGAAFDPKFGLAFSSNGEEGTMTVLGKLAGKWEPVQTLTTQVSARTMTLDPKTHRIYLIAAQFEAGTGRRPMVPGSATILVVAPGK